MMATRKQTPDVLGNLLNEAAPDESAANQPVAPAKSASRPQSYAVAWEYLEIIFRDSRGYRPRYVNRTELADWKELPVMHEYLNQLGAEGWELISITPSPSRRKRSPFQAQSRVTVISKRKRGTGSLSRTKLYHAISLS
ncbi:MAG: DUF4177 domain-containing protein [Caldilineaceae bacterium]|nr:DUF4177 domain-containing protein [Caldilineaceae bacterium]